MGQNSGAGFKNSIATCASPACSRPINETLPSRSSQVLGFISVNFWPIATFVPNITSAPCALTVTVKVSS